MPPDELVPHSVANRNELWRRATLAIFVAGIYLMVCWRPEWMTLLGVGHPGVWFMDTRFVLAASDAAAAGLDPAAGNPFDLMGHPNVYSDWWSTLNAFGVTRADHVWLGAILGLVFLAAALLQLRARSWAEAGCAAALLASPAMIFGFNRGNADLFIFILLSGVVPSLLAKRRGFRWFAPAAILLTTGLKYYPLVAALVLLAPHHGRRKVFFLLLIFALGLGWVAADQVDSLKRYAAAPVPTGFFTFGTGTLARLLGWPQWAGGAIAAALLGGTTAFAWRAGPAWTVSAEQKPEYLQFILGAAILAGCYLVTVSYAYRAVFTIWMAPLLWTARAARDWPRYFRHLGRVLGPLVLLWLWLDGCICLLVNLTSRWSEAEVQWWTDTLMLGEQPLVLVLMAGLLGFLVPFTRDGFRLLVAKSSHSLLPH